MINRLHLIAAIALWSAAVPGRAEALPDPTRPPSFRSGPPAIVELPREQVEWKLSAIRTGEKDRTAIVNDRLVREGDSIGQAKVVSILADKVILEHDDRQVSVRLFHGSIHKTPAVTGTEHNNNHGNSSN